MLRIIIAFPKIEDTKAIKNTLVRSGYEVNATCTSGSQVINYAGELDEGIVICGYRLSDMHYNELNSYLTEEFKMLLIASPKRFEDCTNSGIVCLSMPIKKNDLLSTLEMMAYHYNKRKKQKRIKPKERSEEDKIIINKAKIILMERNNMSEEEAHRYIQKNSMDRGNSMVETAEEIAGIYQL